MISEIVQEIREIDTSPKRLRGFGVTFFVILTAAGGFFLFKGRPLGYTAMGVGVLFLVAGLWAKNSLKALYKIWMGLAVILGFFMSRAILCVVFYLVLTPVGLIMRLLKKDLLDQRWDGEADSYWIKKEAQPFDKRRYEKLF